MMTTKAKKSISLHQNVVKMENSYVLSERKAIRTIKAKKNMELDKEL